MREITQEEYDLNPNISGWFCHKQLKTLKVRGSNEMLPIPLNSIFHLKDGILHNENGPALFFSSENYTHTYLIFFLNGSLAPGCKGLALKDARFAKSEVLYERNQPTNEFYVSPVSDYGIAHLLGGPGLIKKDKAGTFKNGKYLPPKKAKVIEKKYFINDASYARHDFYEHPEQILHEKKMKVRKILS